MARELELSVIALVRQAYGGKELPTPDWRQRPGRHESGRRWPFVCALYAGLSGMELPDVMPPRERRTVDCVLQRRGEPPRIVEVDETQHFNRYRAATIRRYPRSVKVAYDRRAWLAACDAKTRLEGGGFGRPRAAAVPARGRPSPPAGVPGRARGRAARRARLVADAADRRLRGQGLGPRPRCESANGRAARKAPVARLAVSLRLRCPAARQSRQSEAKTEAARNRPGA